MCYATSQTAVSAYRVLCKSLTWSAGAGECEDFGGQRGKASVKGVGQSEKTEKKKSKEGSRHSSVITTCVEKRRPDIPSAVSAVC